MLDADGLHVPHLFDAELLNSVRRETMARELSIDHARALLRRANSFPARRHGHTLLSTRALELRANVSAYDALYVVLAEQLRAGLLTADRRLARAVQTHTDVPVIEVG